jgi:hypothetical protein
MVILADELLEGFFSTDLAASFQLEPSEGEYHVTHAKQDTLVASGTWLDLPAKALIRLWLDLSQLTKIRCIVRR